MEKNIGAFLQEMRKVKGLTQKELAEQIGVSDKTISKWENGNSVPDTSMLLPLCNALDLTVNELLSCEKILPENYSIKAEENIVALIEENTRTKKNNNISSKIGVLIIVLGLLFMAVSLAGLSFPITAFLDMPTLIIILLLQGGVLLVSRARTKEKLLLVISKTIMPIGLMTFSTTGIFMLYNIDDIKVLGPSLAIAILSLLYVVVIKLVVEILIIRN